MVTRVSVVNQEQLGPLDLLDQPDRLDRGETLVSLGQQDLQERMVQQATRDLMDPLEVLEPRDYQACRVRPVHQELLVCPETLGSQVKRDRVGLRERAEWLGTLGRLEALGKWVMWDYQGCREQLVGLAQLALWGRLGRMVPEDWLDNVVILDPEDRMVPLDHQDQEALKGHLDSLGHLEHVELMVNLDWLVQPDLLDFPVLEVIQVLGVRLVPVGRRAVEGTLEIPELPEQPEQLEQLEPQAERDLLERVEHLVCRGSPEYEEHPELMDQLEQLDRLDK